MHCFGFGVLFGFFFFSSWWFVQQFCSSGARSRQEVFTVTAIIYYPDELKAPGTASVVQLCLCRAFPRAGTPHLGPGAGLSPREAPENGWLLTAPRGRLSQGTSSGETPPFDLGGSNCHLPLRTPLKNTPSVGFRAGGLKVTLWKPLRDRLCSAGTGAAAPREGALRLWGDAGPPGCCPQPGTAAKLRRNRPFSSSGTTRRAV